MEKLPPKPPPDNPQEILTVPEAAALLRCGISTIYADVRRKRLPFFKTGRCIRFYKAALLSLKGGR